MLHSHLTTLNAVSLVLNAFKHEGLPSDVLLAGSGISAADLSRADTRITTNQEMQVCANAVAHKRDIGLELGRSMHVSSYGILGYALLTSATLGDALQLALQYPALLGTLFELNLEEDEEAVWLSASDYRENPALAAFNAEFCMVSLKVICNDLLGHVLPLRAARFEHPAPDYHARYGALFDCPVRFDAVDNAFAFDHHWLDQPLPLADPITHHAMVERCRKQNIEFTGRQAWLGRIRQLLAAQLDAAPGLEGLAEQMNCSARTLRRHLKDSGCSYQELLDELRFERAKQMLCEDQLPIHRIAELLGFSETASFRHAFVRWSGVAPSQFRP
ncbi:AraC family transcriptional regulator [Pseudomonas mediterranea]|jgi:AraC-like DNA-binding protein|uniref:AraC-type DNA-binding protein n=1 Tax=Pseudomonas mediterranea TaxID=183795 RepID=A0AAX2D6H9_9PSED|nr:AraC family transcriptional regulator [Pseudomonas mediterranea]KGU82214.1 AraC family transcriptional regulator [Pseudomonas mediterranea CFBP 5447]MBL0844083.1 AraC family transcriptional regulator [Pseudomonas mediterranea]MDU9028091.1 AraC family transcriptional regulator [Pseudomonas mediterranea]UZE00971.1 AraC family transcriptional regulator [Pseudomonas mediterranea]CAH0302052.1 putative HTH-type transcriptional regulator Rv1395 [Pseudomonas mediterranea]